MINQFNHYMFRSEAATAALVFANRTGGHPCLILRIVTAYGTDYETNVTPLCSGVKLRRQHWCLLITLVGWMPLSDLAYCCYGFNTVQIKNPINHYMFRSEVATAALVFPNRIGGRCPCLNLLG